ncbi:MAG: LysR family transcriptional regulator [Oscillospiraceae bacterium]
MSINLEAYRVFLAVAEAGSFSKGAVKLYVTQPAVSQAINSLEGQLGTHLFNRSGKGVTLTDEGSMLYERVSHAISLIESGEANIKMTNRLEAGNLHIGAGDTITKQFLMPYIQKFHTRYPEVSIKVTNRTSPQLIEFLKNGSLDLAVVNLPIDDNSLRIRPCAMIHDIFVAGENFAYLKNADLTCEELAKKPLVMLESQSNSRRYVDNYFAENGVILNPEIELGAYDLLQDFAKIGLGISCVIKEFSSENLQDESLFEVNLMPPIPARQIGVCNLADISLSVAAKQFVKLITQR